MDNAVQTNRDTGLLKIIAFVTMAIDHIGYVFFPQYMWLRVIGRLAFPIFAYCLALGCVYTKNPKKSVRLTKTYDLHEKFDKFAVKDFLDVMSKIATIGTKENDKLLGQKEHLKSQNVYDMLA